MTLSWLYLPSFILLFGAELNSELEYHTAHDTTNTEAPLGERGAWVADHVATDTLTSAAVSNKPKKRSPSFGHVAARRAGTRGARGRGPAKGGMDALARRDLRPAPAPTWQGHAWAALVAAGATMMWLLRERTLEPKPEIKAMSSDIDGAVVDTDDEKAAG